MFQQRTDERTVLVARGISNTRLNFEAAIENPEGTTETIRKMSTMLTIAAARHQRRLLTSASASRAAAVSQHRRAKHTLPDLSYDYNALEPVISADIMKLHHSKHHQAYVNNLVVAEEKFGEAKLKNDLSTMIQLQSAIKFNGGGAYPISMIPIGYIY